MVRCSPVSYDMDLYNEYLFLIKNDTGKIIRPFSLSFYTKDYIHTRVSKPDYVFIIIDFKTNSDIEFDSIKIIDDYNVELGFPRFAYAVILNEGKTISHRKRIVFNNELNILFSDVSKIDTVFKTHNALFFITDPTKFALSDKNMDQQVIMDNENYSNKILNVIYKSNHSLYLIQIKPKVDRDLTYKDIYRLSLN